MESEVELSDRNGALPEKKAKHNLGRLEINRVCNQRCVFCSNPPKSGELGFEEAKRHMLRMKEEGVTDLMITGGEPTLKKDLREIIQLAEDMNFKEITIQTNGSTLHTEERVKMLYPFRHNLKVNVSFHASDRKIFSDLSQAPHTYDNTLKSLENLGKYGIPTNITIVIQKANYMSLKSHIKFLRKSYPFITHFSFNFIDPIFNAWKNKWTVPTLAESEKSIHECFDYITKENCSFRIEKMPLCYLDGFEHCQSNLRRHLFDEKRVCSFFRIEEDKKAEEFFRKPAWKTEEGRSEFFYAPQCAKCSLVSICPGMNSNYVRIHGFDEARPVINKDPGEILQKAAEIRREVVKPSLNHGKNGYIWNNGISVKSPDNSSLPFKERIRHDYIRRYKSSMGEKEFYPYSSFFVGRENVLKKVPVSAIKPKETPKRLAEALLI